MLGFLTTTTGALSLGDLMTAIGTVVTGAVGWVGDFLAEINTTNGLLILPFALGFSLFGLHIMKSLMGR